MNIISRSIVRSFSCLLFSTVCSATQAASGTVPKPQLSDYLTPPREEVWIGADSQGLERAYFGEVARTFEERTKWISVGAEQQVVSGPGPIINFRIDASGQVAGLKVLRRGVWPFGEKLSIEAIRSASPYPVPPSSLLRDSSGVRIVALFGVTDRHTQGMPNSEQLRPILLFQGREQKATPPQLQRGSCELVMPASSIQNAETGLVEVGVMVSAAGTVISTKVLKSSGFPLLDDETAKQLAACTYAPAIDQLGKPISAMALINFEWK